MTPTNNAIIVTKHTALAEYIKSTGMVDKDTEVVNVATLDNIRDKDVYGVLPIRMAQQTRTYTEFPISLPSWARNKELTIDQVKEFMGEPQTYMVVFVPK